MKGTAHRLLALLVFIITLQACELPLLTEEKQSKKKKIRKSNKKKLTKKKKKQTKKSMKLEEASSPSISMHLNESPVSKHEYIEQKDADMSEYAADESEYLSPNETELSYAQQEMLSQINAFRRKGCTCGGQYFPPAAPLTVNHKLVRTASSHAMDMNRKKTIIPLWVLWQGSRWTSETGRV